MKAFTTLAVLTAMTTALAYRRRASQWHQADTSPSPGKINSGTVDAVITLKDASGSAITITGGTEVGHASGTYSHYNGYKVDIRHTTTLDNYIKTRFTKIANRGDGYPQWQAASGNLYCDEGNHWDITVY
ncbi:hypothetical protein FA13DRAFT_1788632 [Coprinellus micaceus]|uniref:Peptidoglycan-binding domain 1 protein n=1 Tax=Coprinellus micaceus TaxID=71717 RepID=A0A4Y7TLH8_COPMI|nr:hypothetical protein FA13DRAFT_1788632 [Coprinellus micaceus]